MNDNSPDREAAVPQVLNLIEKHVDRLTDLTQKLDERLKVVANSQTQEKAEEATRASFGVPLAERIARISEGIENNCDRLQSVLDRLEI